MENLFFLKYNHYIVHMNKVIKHKYSENEKKILHKVNWTVPNLFMKWVYIIWLSKHPELRFKTMVQVKLDQ